MPLVAQPSRLGVVKAPVDKAPVDKVVAGVNSRHPSP
jgi:hypothetical protein